MYVCVCVMCYSATGLVARGGGPTSRRVTAAAAAVVLVAAEEFPYAPPPGPFLIANYIDLRPDVMIP